MYTQRNDRQTGGGAVWLMFFLAVIGVALFLCLTGCATAKDNEISAIKIEPGRKSTTAENIEAGGKVAAGAWDRLFGNKASQEK